MLQEKGLISMSLKKRKMINMENKEYMKEEIIRNKFALLGIIVLTVLWIFNIFWQMISVFELIMIILTILFVIILFAFLIKAGVDYNVILDTVENNPDTQKFISKIEKLTDEEIEEVIQHIKDKE